MPDPLEELQKRLYTPERPTLPESTPVPTLPASLPPAPNRPEDSELPSSAWRRIKIGLAIFLLLGVVVSAYIFYQGFYAFRKDLVDLQLAGPDSITAGEVADWKVSIINHNQSELKDGRLVFQYPDYAQPLGSGGLKETIAVSSLGAGQTFQQDFRAAIIGGETSSRSASANFTFKPSSSNIAFETTVKTPIKISSFPISININLPAQTLSGQTISPVINIKNDSSTDFQNLRVRLEYPSGFKPTRSSDTLSDFNNIWQINGLLPSETKSLTISGQMTGIANESKVFRVFVEGQEGINWQVYKEGGSEMKLAVTPLAVSISSSQADINQVRFGGDVDYKITWKNNLDVPLANLTLKVKLTGAPFDFNNLISNGNFNANTNTIAWDKDILPNLASIQSGADDNLSFRIRLKNNASADNTISVEAIIDSTSQPEGLAVSKISATGSLTLQVPAN